jgi:hypothetical protein
LSMQATKSRIEMFVSRRMQGNRRLRTEEGKDDQGKIADAAKAKARNAPDARKPRLAGDQ